MLAKIKRNKGKLTIAILAAALIIGGTYAWFVITAGGEAVDAELGYMEMEAKFETDVDDLLFQPGDTVDIDGAIKNTGSLGFMAKVTLDTTTTIYSDADGKLLPDGASYQITDDKNISIVYDPDNFKCKMTDDGIIAWYRHVSRPDEYYVILSGGQQDDLKLGVEMNGRGIGNEYMRAVVSLTPGVIASQTRDDAVLDTFGVDRDTDLEMMPMATSAPGRAAVQAQAIQDAVAALFAD